MGPFLSFLKSRNTYCGLTFYFNQFSLHNAAKEQTYYMTLFATSPLLPVYSVLYWSMRRWHTPMCVARDQVIGWARVEMSLPHVIEKKKKKKKKKNMFIYRYL